MSKNGILYYIMGPSGAGKDTLLDAVRREKPEGVIFSHRYITRSRDTGREAHVPLSAEEFALRRDFGLFALAWEAHGTWYCIGLEIDCWLDKGLSVVVNGSRAALDQAQERYPGLEAVYVRADPDLLRRRLLQRGYETREQIENRLARNSDYPPPRTRLTIIDNSGALKQSVERMLDLLEEVPKVIK